MKEIFLGVFKDGNKIYTKNLTPGKKVYGEKLVGKQTDAKQTDDKVVMQSGVMQFREWDPKRSKLGAAILNGLKELPIKQESIVLYLGASTGTTVSHVSDIVGKEGFIYGIEFAERVLRNLLGLANERKNIAAIKADARKPEEYRWIEECNVVFVDLAQPDETQIALRNCDEFLKKGGYLLIAIKSQSIDVTKKPKEIYEQEKKKIEKAGFETLQLIDLEPYEDKHCLILARK